ncbi:MAG TPA: sulfatase-like hydrolase/transferase, partial [bacterium]|nr:sulfatase-like hydrolase/transferase [bacterium]
PDGTMTLEYLVSQYDGAIRYFDDQFAKILESLKSRGIYDNTVIVFVSDHGEEFMEHGALDHGWTLYQEQLSVPFIMKPAGNEKIQWNLHGRVPEIIDIYPTVVAAAGLVCAESNLAGRNLLVEGEPEHAFAEADKKNSMASLTGEGFKYIRQTKAKKAQLFNLEQDPSEQNDLRNGSLDAKWDESVFQRVSESKERSLKPEIATVREAELERLRSMGYVN